MTTRLLNTRERLRAGRPTAGAFEASISTSAEAHLLAAFWSSVRQDVDRLALLLTFTRVAIVRAEGWDPAQVRAEHNANYGQPSTIQLTRSRCFACDADVQLYAHHVIEIQNGGSNTARNQVPLCFDCHQYLHPWLTDGDRVTAAAKGFESLAEIATRVRR